MNSTPIRLIIALLALHAFQVTICIPRFQKDLQQAFLEAATSDAPILPQYPMQLRQHGIVSPKQIVALMIMGIFSLSFGSIINYILNQPSHLVYNAVPLVIGLWILIMALLGKALK